MSLTGLEEVKSTFLSIKAKIETVARQGLDMKKERLGMVMLGNPGTGECHLLWGLLLAPLSNTQIGKMTVARLYAQFLASVNALPGREFVEITGSSLANEGVSGAKTRIEGIKNAGGGVFFLDEAYQLASGNNYGGKAVLDFLLAEIEEQVGKVVFILAGYRKEMEKFFEHNPGFDNRMPHRLNFEDYSDQELLTMLGRMLNKEYAGRVKLEDGPGGLYARILIKRLGRGRGTEGYGNARASENAWAKVTERQASRLHRERVAGQSTDDFRFTKEDLIGPEPHRAIHESDAWKELHSLIGLEAVKKSVQALVDRIQLNYNRELEEKPPIEVSLNRIFLGSPGTGKTTVGKLYGSILADLGLISKREGKSLSLRLLYQYIRRIVVHLQVEVRTWQYADLIVRAVVFKDPADFVGSALGQSQNNTKAILKASEGKVLIIDEAYMLDPGSKGDANAETRTRSPSLIPLWLEFKVPPVRIDAFFCWDTEIKCQRCWQTPILASRDVSQSTLHFNSTISTTESFRRFLI
jgi:DNA replication protein DnaC